MYNRNICQEKDEIGNANKDIERLKNEIVAYTTEIEDLNTGKYENEIMLKDLFKAGRRTSDLINSIKKNIDHMKKDYKKKEQ